MKRSAASNHRDKRSAQNAATACGSKMQTESETPAGGSFRHFEHGADGWQTAPGLSSIGENPPERRPQRRSKKGRTPARLRTKSGEETHVLASEEIPPPRYLSATKPMTDPHDQSDQASLTDAQNKQTQNDHPKHEPLPQHDISLFS